MSKLPNQPQAIKEIRAQARKRRMDHISLKEINLEIRRYRRAQRREKDQRRP